MLWAVLVNSVPYFILTIKKIIESIFSVFSIKTIYYMLHMIFQKSSPFNVLILLFVLLSACRKDTPQQDVPFEAVEGVHYEIYEPSEKSNITEDLKIVSFNTASASKSELQTLLGLLPAGTNVVCLQEVENPADVLAVFSSGKDHRNETGYHSFPYYCQARKNSTKAATYKKEYQMILSKFPIVKHDLRHVNTDPHGDKWKRYGEYVRLKVNSNTSIDLFHYHNTNRADGADKSVHGMNNFRDWIREDVLKVPPSYDPSTHPNLFIVGDLNLFTHGTQQVQLRNILGNNLNYYGDFLDYVVSSQRKNSSGRVLSGSLSDHNIVWASFDISTNRANAHKNVVRLYEDSHFAGRVISFEKSSCVHIPYWHKVQGDDQYWNDRVSSIRVGSNVRLAIYPHSYHSGSVYHLPHLPGGKGFRNDVFSSLNVKAR